MAQIKVSELKFSYEDSFDTVLEDVNFNIDTDWKLGLIGRNGKGKTTLLKIISGLRFCNSGTVSVFGIKPENSKSKFIPLPPHTDLDELLVTKFTRVIDNSGCFSFYNKKFQVVTKDIPPIFKITILIFFVPSIKR